MKKLFIVAAALSITTGAMAQECGDREVTTRSLKATVERLYDKVEEGVESHHPVTIDYARVILSGYDGYLNDKSQDKLDKLVAKERKRFLKGATDQERDYFLAYETIVSGCHELDSKDYYTASLVYMDFVCQYFKMGQPDEALFYLADYLIFSCSAGFDSLNGINYWIERYPKRHEYVNEQLNMCDVHSMMDKYFYRIFKESYAEMNDTELAEVYIKHVEAVVEWYERGDIMETIRHVYAMHVIREYSGHEVWYNAHMAWAAENYEMAVAHHDYIEELFSLQQVNDLP